MADEIDLAQEREELERQAILAQEREELERQAILAARPKFELDPGTPGDCLDCGDWSSRLVESICPPCRDRVEKARRRLYGK